MSKTSLLLKRDRDDILAAMRPPIEDSAAIREYIKAVTGYHIPDVPVCEGHSTPADLYRLIFDPEQTKIIVRANRGGMKSLSAALILWLNARAIPRWEATVLAGSGDQAKRCYSHTLEFWDAMAGRFRGELVGKPLQELTKLVDPDNPDSFRGGSKYGIIYTSQASARGGHPNALIVDEADEIKSEVYEAAVSQPMDKGEGARQWLVLSTVNRAGGLMENLIREYTSKPGWAFLCWCWKEVTQTCPESMKCEACPLYNAERIDGGTGYCRGEMKRKDLEGYLPIGHILDVYDALSRETWETEWCCFETAVKGAVLRRSDLEACLDDVKFQPGLETWVGIDWGYTAPTVCHILQLANPHDLRFVASVRWQQRTGSDLAKFIGDICDERGATRAFADASHPSHIEELRQRGIDVTRVPFGAGGGVKPLKQRLLEQLRVWVEGKGGRKLRINRNMVESINELRDWHYKDNTQTEQIAKEDDHGPDALLCGMVPFVGATVRAL